MRRPISLISVLVAPWPSGPGNQTKIVGKWEGAESLRDGTRFEWAVRSAGWEEVWEFTIPPTPHTSVYCHPGEAHADRACFTLGMDWLKPGYHEVRALAVDVGTGLTVASSPPLHISAGDVRGAAALKSSVTSKREDVSRQAHQQQEAARRYGPLHGHLRELADWQLDPGLVEALRMWRETGSTATLVPLLNRLGDGVYSIKVFSPSFCELMVEELEHAQRHGGNMTAPNSMNRYGFVLAELGFSRWLDAVLAGVMAPLAATAFPTWGGDTLDSHHAFTISYALGGDTSLARHMDESAVTLNACLGKTFSGAEVVFDGERDARRRRGAASSPSSPVVVRPEVGVGILHAGQNAHMTRQLESGERHNIVFWGRSSAASSSAAETFLEGCDPGGSGAAADGRCHLLLPGENALQEPDL